MEKPHRKRKSKADIHEQITRLAHASGKKKEGPNRLEERLTNLTSLKEQEVTEILDAEPQFYSQKEGEQQVQLSPEIAQLLPEEAHTNYSGWIESLPNIRRGAYTDDAIPKGETIRELIKTPYDISKVKYAELTGESGEIVPVVIKRLNRDEATEPERAQHAYEAGIPTPQVYGTIESAGNTYLVSEYVESLSLHEIDRIAREYRIAIHSSFTIFKEELDKLEQLKKYPEIKKAFLQEYLRKQRYLVAEVMTYLITGMGNIIGKTLEAAQQAIREEIKDSIKRGTWSIELVDQAFEALGIESIDELTAQIPYDETGNLDFERLETEYFPMRDALREKMREQRLYPVDLQKIFEKMATGATIQEHKKRLQQECENAGIQHGDLANRNIIVEWDLRNNIPPTDRIPRVLLIDWAEKDN